MLWGDSTAPRRGWNIQNVFDALEGGPGEPLLESDHMLTCEACSKREIRYVHVLEHPEFDRAVLVGCECAAKMTGATDEDVQSREVRVRNRSARRATFCDNRNWTQTRKGGLRLRHMRNLYVLTPDRHGGWSGSYKLDGQDGWGRVNGFLHDLEEAKLALFDSAHPSGRPANRTRDREE